MSRIETDVVSERPLRAAARLGALLLVSLIPAVAKSAAADDFPKQPIRMIVPYAAGGADQYIRPLVPALQAALGQSIIIENIGGAGGMIGANTVKNSAPDGHTLLFTATAVLTIAPKVNQATYAMSDFKPVCNVIEIPFIVAARKDAPFKDITQLRDYARQNPQKVSFGSAGIGTATNLAGEMMARAMDAQMMHVPFQGMTPAVTLLMGGGIDTVVGAPSVVMPHVRNGSINGLATTGPKRADGMDDFPTLLEAGIDVDTGTRYGFFAPAGTPDAVIAKLSHAVESAVQSPDYVANMRAGYNGVHYMDSAEYGEVIAKESQTYDALIQELGLGAK